MVLTVSKATDSDGSHSTATVDLNHARKNGLPRDQTTVRSSHDATSDLASVQVRELVELRGLEPLTPCVQSRCSSS